MRKMKKEDLLLEVLSYMRLIIVCLIVAFLLKTLVLKPRQIRGFDRCRFGAETLFGAGKDALDRCDHLGGI